MVDIDHIEIRPDTFGWTVRIAAADANYEFGIGDAIQWVHETERTLSKWLADGPADFHGTTFIPPDFKGEIPEGLIGGYRPSDPDLARDIERGK